MTRGSPPGSAAPRRSASPTPTTCCASSAPRWPRTCATARTPPPRRPCPPTPSRSARSPRGRAACSPGSRPSARCCPRCSATGTRCSTARAGRRPAGGGRARARRPRPRPRPAHRRAHRAQPALPPLRRRHRHGRLGRRGRRHRRADPRHPQDAAGPAAAGEVRGALRRRGQPPARARRRRADQGQPRGGGRVGRRGAATAPGPRRRTCRARWRSTRSTSSTRCWRWARSWCCSTTSRVAQTAEAVRRRGSTPTLLESSGGLALANARAYAETGVEFLAVGALTHSVTALDVGLDLQETDTDPPFAGVRHPRLAVSA